MSSRTTDANKDITVNYNDLTGPTNQHQGWYWSFPPSNMLGPTKNIFTKTINYSQFEKCRSRNFSLWPHGLKRRHAQQQGKGDGAEGDESSFISARSSVFVRVFATKSTTPTLRVGTWGAVPFNSPFD